MDCCSSRDCGVDCSTSCVLPVATIITSVKRVEHCAKHFIVYNYMCVCLEFLVGPWALLMNFEHAPHIQ